MPAILFILAMVAWSIAREYLDPDTRAHVVFTTLDYGLDGTKSKLHKLIGPFYNIFEPILGKSPHQSYEEHIRALKPEDIVPLIQTLKAYHQGSILVYIHSLECRDCDANYEDVEALTSEIPKELLLPLVFTIAPSRRALSDYYNVRGYLPPFRPLLLQETTKTSMNQLQFLRNTDYTGPPHMVLITPEGKAANIKVGPKKSVKIRRQVKQLIQQYSSQ